MLGDIFHTYPAPLYETAIRRGLFALYEGTFGGRQNFFTVF